MISYLIDFLIILPLAMWIHQLGHGLGVKLFRGSISELTLGQGKVFLKIGKVKLKTFLFMGGSFSYLALPNYKPLKKVIILLCGTGLNLISILLAFILMDFLTMPPWLTEYMHHFISLSGLIALVAMLPLSLGSTKLDGLQIKELLMFHQNPQKKKRKAS